MASDLEQEILIWRAATFLLLAAVALLAWPAAQRLREAPPSPTPATRLSFAPPSANESLGAGDEALDAAISPDGRQIVFVATSDGTPRLWRRPVDADRATPLPGTEGAQQPAWKPTGNVVSFLADGMLKQLSLADGGVRDLTEARGAAGQTWLPDGSLLFGAGARGPLHHLRASVATDATELRPGDRAHVFPVAFGDKGDFVYVAIQSDGRRNVRIVIDGRERDVTTTSGHAQLVGDVLIHVRDNTLLAQRFDVETGALVDRSFPLGVNVGVSPGGRALVTASPRLLIFAAPAVRTRELAWFDLEGRRTGTSGDPGDYWQVRLSNDDRHVAATMLDPLLRALDIFVVPSDGGGAERLTLALAADSDPVWSPDGRRVLFRSFQDGQPNLFTRLVGEAGASDEALLRSDLDETPSDWSALPRPGGQVLYAASSSGANSDVWMLDGQTGSVTALAKTGFNETDARWSPDRRWLSFVSDESGQPDVYATRWPDGGRVRVSFAGGTRPRWGRDGRSLFFLRGEQIMRSERIGDDDAPFAPARRVLVAPGIRDFDTAHRSDRLLVLTPVQFSASANVQALLDWQSVVPRTGQ